MAKLAAEPTFGAKLFQPHVVKHGGATGVGWRLHRSTLASTRTFASLTFTVSTSAVSTTSSMAASSTSKTILDGIFLPSWSPFGGDAAALPQARGRKGPSAHARGVLFSRAAHRKRLDRSPAIHLTTDIDSFINSFLYFKNIKKKSRIKMF